MTCYLLPTNSNNLNSTPTMRYLTNLWKKIHPKLSKLYKNTKSLNSRTLLPGSTPYLSDNLRLISLPKSGTTLSYSETEHLLKSHLLLLPILKTLSKIQNSKTASKLYKIALLISQTKRSSTPIQKSHFLKKNILN